MFSQKSCEPMYQNHIFQDEKLAPDKSTGAHCILQLFRYGNSETTGEGD